MKNRPPLEAIGKLLADAMDQAVANGADSRSMPDDLVEIALWLDKAGRATPDYAAMDDTAEWAVSHYAETHGRRLGDG